MSSTIELTLSDQLLADIEPALSHGQITLDKYILEAVIWYTHYQHQRQIAAETPNLHDVADVEYNQSQLLTQIHEELAPYTVDVLQKPQDETEADWKTLLA